MNALMTFLFLGVLMLNSLRIAAADPGGKMIIFVLQTDRQRPALENDAVLMANVIAASGSDDILQAFTTSDTEIFSLKPDAKQSKPFQVQLAKQRTIEGLKHFFLQLFNSPSKEKEPLIDIAGALVLAMDRLNLAPPYPRLVLVVLGDGLQQDRSVNFDGCYPSDSWITHELSPFSVIKAKTAQVKLDIVMVPQKSDYVNTYHRAKIERWYGLLFQRKQAALIGFTFDHQSAAKLILQGGPPLQRFPDTIDLNGPLTLTRVSEMTTEEK